jgi:hypothetical protein
MSLKTGNLSLTSFIKEVKDEIEEAIKVEDKFFILNDIELEVSFSLQSEAGGSFKLFVAEVGGKATASQTHKVKLNLTPIGTPISNSNSSGQRLKVPKRQEGRQQGIINTPPIKQTKPPGTKNTHPFEVKVHRNPITCSKLEVSILDQTNSIVGTTVAPKIGRVGSTRRRFTQHKPIKR